jgi:succinyl-CoA synthetase beta subunit
VQPMIRGGVELSIGFVRDEIFGAVVFAGLGGVLIEILQARVGLRPPFDVDDATRTLGRLLDGRLTTSRRGLDAEQVGALARAMCAVAAIALEVPDVASLDINPLVFDSGTLCALDALVVFDPVDGPDQDEA